MLLEKNYDKIDWFALSHRHKIYWYVFLINASILRLIM